MKLHDLFIILPLVSAVSIPLWGLDTGQQTSQSGGAATALPDISFIINTSAYFGFNAANFPPLTNLLSESGASIDEAEVNVESYIFPGVKARAVLSVSGDGGIEVEEAYANATVILDFFGLKAGRSRLGFGKINPIHPHAWAYADTPSVIENFIGELKGDGADLSMIFPLPFFVQLDLTGCRFLGSDSGYGVNGFGGLARIWTSTSLGDAGELELGASALMGNGPLYTNQTDSLTLFGADMTLRLWPAPSQRLMWQTEYIFSIRVMGAGAPLYRMGLYSYMGYRLDKTWEIGARYDVSQGNGPADSDFRNSVNAILTYNMTEMTLLRLQYNYGFNSLDNRLTLQFVFGMGPHTHPIQ